MVVVLSAGAFPIQTLKAVVFADVSPRLVGGLDGNHTAFTIRLRTILADIPAAAWLLSALVSGVDLDGRVPVDVPLFGAFGGRSRRLPAEIEACVCGYQWLR